MGLNTRIGGTVTVLVAEYDFAKDGGAIGTITMRSLGEMGSSIPSGAIIKNGLLQVLTAVTGTGASVALQAESAGDLVATAAISGAPWSTTGMKTLIPQGAASAILTTAERPLKMVISAAVLTAGKFRVYVDYM
jgi:hypothetical protein